MHRAEAGEVDRPAQTEFDSCRLDVPLQEVVRVEWLAGLVREDEVFGSVKLRPFPRPPKRSSNGSEAIERNFRFASLCLHIVELSVVDAFNELNAIRRTPRPASNASVSHLIVG
jgi:hypothetical protein